MTAEAPTRYAAAALVAGILVAAPVLALGPALATLGEGVGGGYGAPIYRAFGNAALPEELCKLVFIALLVRRVFSVRAPVRAMAVGALVGFGFGAVETVFYSVHNGAGVGLVRLFTAVPCHVFLGAVMAHYLWAALMTRSRVAATKSLLVPVLIHGLYNFPLMAAFDAVVVEPGGTMLLTWMVLFLLAGWTRLLLAGYRRQIFLDPA